MHPVRFVPAGLSAGCCGGGMNYARGNLKTEGGNPKSEIRNPKEIRKLKAERTLCEEMSCEGFEFWRWGDEVGTELMALREGAAGYARGNPKSENRKPKEIRKLKAERTLCEEMSCEGFEFWRWGDEVGTELMALREGAAGKTPARGIGRTHGAVWREDCSRSLVRCQRAKAHFRRDLEKITMLMHGYCFGFRISDFLRISVFETSDLP